MNMTQDPLYERLHSEALQAEQSEPAISSLLRRTILDDDVSTFNQAVAATIAHRLGRQCGSSPDICPKEVRGIINDALESEERVLGWTMAEAVREDVVACIDRDPACLTVLEPLLFFKGFAALVLHRAARRRWGKATSIPGQTSRFVSFWLQSQASSAFGVDIHPAATIGKAIMLDHATGIVIGETAVVGDGCSFLHGVTLGGTGKSKGKDRHPKVGKDVLIGAGSSVLGNISIGDGAKIGAGSVVLQPIPHGATAVGAPAKVLGRAKESKPGSENDASMKDVCTFHTRRDKERVRRRMRKSKSLGFYEGNKVFRNNMERKTTGANGVHGGQMNEAITKTPPEDVDGNPDRSSSDEESKDDVNFSRKKSSPDAEMCVWRSFGTDAPQGTLNIYQIRRILLIEGVTEAEIGEVFFSLVDDEPYITEEVLREKFPDVGKKYTKLDCKSLNKILESMCVVASQQPQSDKIDVSERPRRNSIPIDAKLNLDDSTSSGAAHSLSLPTITSQVCFVDGLDSTKR